MHGDPPFGGDPDGCDFFVGDPDTPVFRLSAGLYIVIFIKNVLMIYKHSLTLRYLYYNAFQIPVKVSIFRKNDGHAASRAYMAVMTQFFGLRFSRYLPTNWGSLDVRLPF